MQHLLYFLPENRQIPCEIQIKIRNNLYKTIILWYNGHNHKWLLAQLFRFLAEGLHKLQ